MNDNLNIEQRIINSLNSIRKYLQIDGGDVEFVRFEEETSTAEIKLTGNCSNCPLNMMTLRAGIEKVLIRDVPEIRRVEKVN